jgi:hypothetical protein
VIKDQQLRQVLKVLRGIQVARVLRDLKGIKVPKDLKVLKDIRVLLVKKDLRVVHHRGHKVLQVRHHRDLQVHKEIHQEDLKVIEDREVQQDQQVLITKDRQVTEVVRVQKVLKVIKDRLTVVIRDLRDLPLPMIKDQKVLKGQPHQTDQKVHKDLLVVKDQEVILVV